MAKFPHLGRTPHIRSRSTHLHTSEALHTCTFVTQVVTRLRMLRRTGLHISAHLPAHVRSSAHLHTSAALRICTRPRLCTRRHPLRLDGSRLSDAPRSYRAGEDLHPAPSTHAPRLNAAPPRTIQPRNAAPPPASRSPAHVARIYISKNAPSEKMHKKIKKKCINICKCKNVVVVL